MPTPNPIIFAAVLAAGESSRFGSSKQLAKLDGVTLIRRAAATAAEVLADRVIVVAGADWQRVVESAADQSRFFVLCDDYENGIGNSIACVARACAQRADALLLTLGDQPLVTAAHLRDLIAAWSGSDKEIVASAYADTVGPPVLFPRAAFSQLAALSGDRGARSVLRDPRFKTVSLEFADAGKDIDTPLDLQTLATAKPR